MKKPIFFLLGLILNYSTYGSNLEDVVIDISDMNAGDSVSINCPDSRLVVIGNNNNLNSLNLIAEFLQFSGNRISTTSNISFQAREIFQLAGCQFITKGALKIKAKYANGSDFGNCVITAENVTMDVENIR